MELFDVIGELYKANNDEKPRFFVNQGGTSSGKTYTIMQRLIVLTIENPMTIITVVGQDLPNLKVGALRDLGTIISGSSWLKDWFRQNRSESTFRAKNGALIEFKSYKDAQDAKNGKRDYLFINEANGVAYDVFWQLQIRTRRQVFIDYNPTARFWVHDKIIGRDDAKLIISDHRNNRFLSEGEHRKIEEIEDRSLWMVYARGLTGKISGLILTRWDAVDSLPPRKEWKMDCGYGMDFGFTNDPTTLVHLVYAHGELWVDNPLYEAGLTNPEIAARCKDEGLTRRDLIVADCAEEKSIKEIHNQGLWIIPCSKGKDSVSAGIDILKRYRIHVTRRSRGLIDELGKYKYRVDRDGRTTNQPIDAFNHAIDALRYIAMKRLSVSYNGSGKAYITREE